MSNTRKQYPFDLIEPKWQQFWDRQQTFRAWNPGETLPPEHPFAQRHGLGGRAPSTAELPPKYYILDMFPYPSGAGLHVGHPEGYTATDILARYRRACGFNVLHPMGWDAFGLPAEQYAIKTGQHPRKTTETNIANFKRQIQSLGFSYDWSREVDTTDPGYFKWTQWIFLKLYNSWFNPAANRAEPIETLACPPELKTENEQRAYRDNQRLAFVAEAPVNWCPELGTVLANEEVIDGKSEVGGFPVVRRPMRQWMLRITAYAERLLNDLDLLQWSDSLKEMQRNWIGRSEGAEVEFEVANGGLRMADADRRIRVFTTRPDTLFGATYMVLAPEHKLVDQIALSEWPANTPDAWKGQNQSAVSNPPSAIAAYRAYAAGKSDLERTELAKEKTGVFTGAYATNPVNGEKIPIWIADYVLISYGTGAIMAVPAHDTRDLAFAQKFNLPVRLVVQAPEDRDSIGFVDDGTSVNSGFISGLPTPEAKKKISAWLEAKGVGRTMINYKLRDWLFSRQRYWGEPFPIVWKRDSQGNLCHEALPENALPLVPPPMTDYKPTPDGEPPLARARDWVNLPDGSRRETNTMPQWAGSCWYYLRFLDSQNAQAFVGGKAEAYWMGSSKCQVSSVKPATAGVDLYVGGTEHAVLHLLYARFWHKVLFDLGYVSTPEPFFKLVNQGLILGEVEYLKFEGTDGDGRTFEVSADKLVNITPMSAGEARAAAYHNDDPKGQVFHGFPVAEDDLVKTDKGYVLKHNPALHVHAQCFKMSKSRGNVINPDDILQEYGADAFRLYEMFMGPLEMVKPWNTRGVEGVYRFLGRVWRLFVDEASETEFEQAMTTAAAHQHGELLARLRLSAAIQDVAATPAQLKALHTCIKKVTEDLDRLRFNIAISALMMFVNDAIGWPVKPVAVMRDFLALLQPFAPHLAEELWSWLPKASNRQPQAKAESPAKTLDLAGWTLDLAYAPWPRFDPRLLIEDVIEMPVQINGKVRDRISVPADATPAQVEAAALAYEKIKPLLEGKTIKKVIVVPRKIVNIVVA